ncbi:cytochrome b/b6 domain-containing protein, partial [Streptomyces sp. MS06]
HTTPTYDPLTSTGQTVPVYDNPGADAYGGRDLYDTGETNGHFGTYSLNDPTYQSGPATEPFTGAPFDAPGPGEPWNTPSGGHR